MGNYKINWQQFLKLIGGWNCFHYYFKILNLKQNNLLKNISNQILLLYYFILTQFVSKIHTKAHNVILYF